LTPLRHSAHGRCHYATRNTQQHANHATGVNTASTVSPQWIAVLYYSAIIAYDIIVPHLYVVVLLCYCVVSRLVVVLLCRCVAVLLC
jgi:hypothetical protein